MPYRDNFFYEYVNIRVNRGMSKYKAITHYLNNIHVPEEYKHMECIQYEYDHSLVLLADEFSENISQFLHKNPKRII